MDTTTQPVTANVMVEKAADWVISSQAPQQWGEGSTTSAWSPRRTVKRHECGATVYKKVTGIYAITHAPTDSVYYGSAVCVRGRINMHKRELRNGAHPNAFLQGVFDKYGDELEFKVVEMCSRDSLRQREQAYINAATGRLMNLNRTVCELATSDVHSARMRVAWSKRDSARRKAIAAKISATLKQRYVDSPEMLKSAKDTLVAARASTAMMLRKTSRSANAKRGQKTRAQWAARSAEQRESLAAKISETFNSKKVFGKRCEHCETAFLGTLEQRYCAARCRVAACKARHR